MPLWLHFKPKQAGKGSEIEKKNYRFVSFRTDVLEKIQEKQRKNSINKKIIPLWLHFKPKQVGKG